MDIKTLLASLVLGLLTLASSGCDQRRSSSPADQPEPQTQAVDGLTFYYGVVKGAAVKEHLATHTEATMHKGPPASPASYHIVLTLFETASNKRVGDAAVAVRLGRSSASPSEWLPMEAMRDVGSESYGRYTNLPDPGKYLVEFRVSRAGRPKPVTARFALERPE